MKLVDLDTGEAEFSAALRTLRFRYHKWDAYAVGRCLILPASLVLTRQEHSTVVRIAEAYHDLLGRLESRLAGCSDTLRKLGIPKALDGILGNEPSSPLQLARYDFFLQPDGSWMISEFNEDVPGGFNEAVGLPELLSLPGESYNHLLRNRLVSAFPAGEPVALWFATAYSEDFQHMLILKDWLEADGREGLLLSPAHLRAGLFGFRARGRKVSWGVRFYPAEWLPWLPNLGAWERLAETGRVMNPVRRLIRQSKKITALVHLGEDGVLDPTEKDAFCANTPASHWLDAPALEQARAGRAEWVLKRAFGRMGDAVTMGCMLDAAAWEKALDAALQEPQLYTLQRRFHTGETNWRERVWHTTVGVYLVNGKFAGYYSRIAENPLIDHSAYHVTTVVENT